MRRAKIAVALFSAAQLILLCGGSRAEERSELHTDDDLASTLSTKICEQWNEYVDNGHDSNLHPLMKFGDEVTSLAHMGSHRSSLLATDFLLRYGSGASGEMSHDFLIEGMRVAIRRHRNNPHLIPVLHSVGDGGIPEPKVERFLRELITSSDNPTVTAAAALALARLLDHFAHLRLHFDEYRSRLELAHPDSSTQLDQLHSHIFTRDPSELRTEAAALLDTILAKYPNERPILRYNVDWMSFDARFARNDDQPTYGELASSHRFAITHLREGCIAPDIVGTDEDGKSFRLTDYRGSVVLLIFSYPSCTACRLWYPINRELLSHFEDNSFTVLGVWTAFASSDTVSGLRDSKGRGEVTWRCWWDGRDGPISKRWNIGAWPRVYLIDSHGVIRRIRPERDPDTLKLMITKLLADG